VLKFVVDVGLCGLTQESTSGTLYERDRFDGSKRYRTHATKVTVKTVQHKQVTQIFVGETGPETEDGMLGARVALAGLVTARPAGRVPCPSTLPRSCCTCRAPVGLKPLTARASYSWLTGWARFGSSTLYAYFLQRVWGHESIMGQVWIRFWILQKGWWFGIPAYSQRYCTSSAVLWFPLFSYLVTYLKGVIIFYLWYYCPHTVILISFCLIFLSNLPLYRLYFFWENPL